MSSPVTLTFPQLSVIHDLHGQLEEIIVQPTSRDAAAYELQAHKHNWPTEQAMKHAPFLYFGAMAWSALRRSPEAPEKLKTKGVQEFLDTVLEVTPAVDEDGEEITEEVDPTQAGATPASD